MAFDIMRLFDGDDYVSPGSIGGKIKKYRELRGWSQKELGIRCGFSASTADVRIAQYEKNKKIPREKALKDIAAALSIDECALFDADMIPYNRMYHALFDMEDFHGLHPVKKDDGYYLEFSGSTVLDKSVTKLDYNGFLKKWYEMRQKYQPNSSDTSEEKATKAKEYSLWRGEYPYNDAKETSEKMRDAMRERRLQAELDELYAKRNSEAEINRIDKALEGIMPEVSASYTPIEKESDLIYLIKKTLEKGLPLEQFTPEERAEIDYDYVHLFSVKSEDITKDDDSKRLYALLVCAIETLQQHRINIVKSITSKDKVLYVTYKYPSSQYRFFENLQRSWADISYIIERQPHWSEEELNDLEEQFRIKITGENDVSFDDNLSDEE
ncbi:helix-turn-helix domain-containing protein [Oribacterium sp. NK2B42]|uniref:helix-turn-helix domain-containing protein n=1 Tax=Oribacterium sp. NK2B42 TaxID=689781 RepID=UPI0003F87A23|nr:helix-turn-helix transcriptional regulator [Oribacterium sp. NK2B42]